MDFFIITKENKMEMKKVKLRDENEKKRILVSIKLSEVDENLDEDEKESVEVQAEVYVPKKEIRTIEGVIAGEEYNANELSLLIYDEVYRWANLLERVDELTLKQLEDENDNDDDNIAKIYYKGLGK